MGEDAIAVKTQESERPSFRQVVLSFITHIESLANSLPVLLTTIEATNKKAIKVHQKFLDTYCEKVGNGDEEVFLVKTEHVSKSKQLRKEVAQARIAHKIIQRNYVVSLVSQFDSFIGSLIRTMFYVKPEILNKSEKQLNFSELAEFADLNAAKDFIIEKEVESVLRENHTSHFKWLEERLGTTLRKDLDVWPVFIELTERRNLYVHNNGIVSTQYVRICEENSVQHVEEKKIGDELTLEPEYFQTAFECVFELGVKLSQVMWRKLQPKDLDEADFSILDISYELLQTKQYNLAQVILDFSDKYIKKFSSDDLKYRLILNRAQSYKWQGEQEKCSEIVNKIDWTACKDIFQLASQVLLDDFDSAVLTMKTIGKGSSIRDKIMYKEWPIFKEFRKQQSFIDCFKEVFGEPFEVKEAFASSGFRVIEKEKLKEELAHCMDIAASKPNGFVGTKFFVETHLADSGYDIGSNYETLNQLRDEEVLEYYSHVDPTGKFPPVNAIRMKH